MEVEEVVEEVEEVVEEIAVEKVRVKGKKVEEFVAGYSNDGRVAVESSRVLAESIQYSDHVVDEGTVEEILEDGRKVLVPGRGDLQPSGERRRLEEPLLSKL